MRFTNILLKHSSRFAYKEKWKYAQKQILKDSGTVEKLEHEGVKVVDALEFTRSNAKIEPSSRVVIPELYDGYKFEPEEEKNWHERICHFFTPDTCLMDGEPHALALTKTYKIEGLPSPLENFYNTIKTELVEESARRAILYSHVWDAYQEKLPPLTDKERPWRVFKRVYGIPKAREISLLLSSLIRIGDVHNLESHGMESSTVLADVHASCPIEKDGDLLQFRVKADFAMSRDKFLSPLIDQSETIDNTIPDIYPLKPTLDLTQQNSYELHNYCTIPKSSRYPYIHTIFLPHSHLPETWNQGQIVGQAIGSCFGFSATQAKQHFGNSVKKLPHSIVLQCVQTDGKTFNFLVYQLNTLDVNGEDGIKNVVWVDAGHELMTTCQQVGGRTKFEGFNPDVIKRFLALYLNCN